MTEDKVVGWHHQLNGCEFEQTHGVGEEQGSLACCSPWGHKELDTIEVTEHTREGWASLMGLVVKNPPANAGDRHKRHGFYPWVSKSPGGRHDKLLQYPCLGNSMDNEFWWATVCGIAESDITEVN